MKTIQLSPRTTKSPEPVQSPQTKYGNARAYIPPLACPQEPDGRQFSFKTDSKNVIQGDPKISHTFFFFFFALGEGGGDFMT